MMGDTGDNKGSDMSNLKADIVICVHNALEDVRNCVASVQATDYPRDQWNVVLVDDGSGPETAAFLDQVVAQDPHVTLVRHDSAKGYTVAANAGLAATQGDIAVLLNSDTVVPARWLQKIARVFDHSPDIGLVGPLSNAASWQTIPERSAPQGGWMVNDLPTGMSVDDFDALVEEQAGIVPVIPRVPLLNGFCYAIRRDTIKALGGFDEVGFPFGFGEEDDFSLRTTNAGFGLALAVDTYVFHAKSKSFGSERRNALTEAGQSQLKLKHGVDRLKRSVATMRDNPYIAMMRDAVKAKVAARG